MKKNLNWIACGVFAGGFCLSLALCFVLFARLSRIERAARTAEAWLHGVRESAVSFSGV